jgi:hypothetical protein
MKACRRFPDDLSLALPDISWDKLIYWSRKAIAWRTRSIISSQLLWMATGFGGLKIERVKRLGIWGLEWGRVDGMAGEKRATQVWLDSLRSI